MSINNVTITGNLTKDAEVRYTNGGMAIASIGIAVNDRRKNQQGQWEDKANFFDCKMFGKRAESLQRYLTKGQKVAIQGKLSYDSWTANDGSKRSRVEIVVDDIELLGGKQQQSQQQESYYDSDLPF